MPTQRRIVMVRVLAAVLGLTLTLAASDAQAGSRTTLSWRLAHAKVNAGARPVATYRVKHAHPGDIVVLQRQRGKGWVRLAASSRSHGRLRGKRLGRGRYELRVAVLTARKRVRTSSRKRLQAYADVSFSALARGGGGTATIAGAPYGFAWSASAWSRRTTLFIENSTCRSLKTTAAYIAPAGSDGQAAIATVSVIQRSSSHATAVPSNSVASLNAPLAAGSFAVTVEDAPGTAYGDGTASCWSITGRPPTAKTTRAIGHGATVANTNHSLPGYVVKADCKKPDYSCVANTGYAPNQAGAGQWWYDDFYREGSQNAAGKHNCTTYVAFRLFQNGVHVDPGFASGGWDATVWARRAGELKGVTVDQTPAIGAIAQWNAGHVGYIDDYRPGGDGYIVVSSDSFVDGSDGGHTSVFKIPLGSKGMPDNILHFATPKAESTMALSADQTKGIPFVHHIVQWTGDTKAQKTSWYVEMSIVPPRTYAIPTRHWIPDIKTYWCLVKQRGAPQPPDVLPPNVLDKQIPDQYGSWASCDTSTGGRGADGGAGDWSGVSEQAGHHGAPTFADPHTASGPGPAVPAGAYVEVLCKALDGNVASANPDGYWYQIGGDPWNGRYWAAANVFMNGDAWNGPYTHNTDLAVPDCGKGGSIAGGGSSTAIGSWLQQQGHHGAKTFSDPHSASGPGPAINPGEYVLVSCKLKDPTIASVNPDGYWYRLADTPWNNAYYAAANTFMNGDPWNGPYTHNTDLAVPDCPQAASDAGGGNGAGAPTFAAQQGHHGVHTFSNPHNASGLGPDIPPGRTVQVACKVLDTTISSVNPDGYWYRIAEAPWNGAYYAPANTFMNGDPWSGPYTHNTDFAIPDCGNGGNGGGVASPTYSETTGGVTHTWTNYQNAGGTEGPTVASNQTIQIACRLQGFAVANGNTWWYRIASSPWDNTYYASADAFYNNGQTTGPLQGTPYVDPQVRDC